MPDWRMCGCSMAAGLALACSATSTQPRPSPESESRPTALRGSVAGFELTANDAVFVRGFVGDRELMLIALTDLDDACAGQLDGTLSLKMFEPETRVAGSRLIVWTVIGQPGRVPIGPGAVELAIPAFEGPSRLPPKGPGPFGFPLLTTSDGSCRAEPTELELETARVELRLLDAPAEGPVIGELVIGQGVQALAGRFSARSCGFPPATPHAPLASTCTARPSAPRRLAPAELEALAEFVPLGPSMGERGVCWQAQLSCRPAPAAQASDRRIEVIWKAAFELSLEPIEAPSSAAAAGVTDNRP